MKHLFIPYELALKAKELGFNEPCLTYFEPKQYDKPTGEQILRAIIKTTYLNAPYKDADKHIGYCNSEKEMFNKNIVAAPLYQQVIDWLRENYSIYIRIYNQFNDEKIAKYYGYEVTQNSSVRSSKAISDNYYEVFSKAIEQAFELITKK